LIRTPPIIHLRREKRNGRSPIVLKNGDPILGIQYVYRTKRLKSVKGQINLGETQINLGETMTTTTLFLAVSPDDEQAHAITTAAQILRNGGLVAFPTETVYGLGADALNQAAIARIYAAKQRPWSDPLIVHVGARQQVMDVAESIPPLADLLMEYFWPGPLTLILPRRASVPDIVAGGGPTLGIRMPDHPVALSLLHRAGIPVAAPSANRFMHTSPTTARHVLADLDGRIDCILDGGACPVGIESTVLDVTSTPPRILRPGGVTKEALERFVPQISGPDTGRAENLAAGEVPDHLLPAAFVAPGQLERHYAPHTRLVVFDAGGIAAMIAIHSEIKRLQAGGDRVGVLLAAGEEQAIAGLQVEVAWFGPPDRLDMISSQLYAVLRDMDQRGLDVIVTHTFGTSGLGLAIWDRLRRAAGGHFQDLPEAHA
jgi:L-threonylcarbamoyladenylate synthase